VDSTVGRRSFLALVAALLLCASPVSAQIAFDASGAGGVSSSSWSHTVGAGSNRLLVVGEFDDTGGSNLLTAVNWNTSESFTKIGQIQTPGDRWVSLWYLLNPTATTANITLTTTAGAFEGFSTSYSGVGALDVSGTGTAAGSPGPVTTTITVATNAWIVSILKEDFGGGITWTNATSRKDLGTGLHMADSNGPLSGSQTTQGSLGGGSHNYGMVSASFTVSGGGGGLVCTPTISTLGVGRCGDEAR